MSLSGMRLSSDLSRLLRMISVYYVSRCFKMAWDVLQSLKVSLDVPRCPKNLGWTTSFKYASNIKSEPLFGMPVWSASLICVCSWAAALSAPLHLASRGAMLRCTFELPIMVYNFNKSRMSQVFSPVWGVLICERWIEMASDVYSHCEISVVAWRRYRSQDGSRCP